MQHNSKMLLAAAGLLCLGILLASGCATTNTRSASTAPAAPVDSLKVGMRAAEVRRIWGEPASVSTMEFGQNTGQTWNGVVYTYSAGRDPRFAYSKRYFRNRLVFAMIGADTILNHWSIEEKEVAKFQAVKESRY